MMYTLKGDRKLEYAFIEAHVARRNAWALDIGPGRWGKSSQDIIRRGRSVVAVDLEDCRYRHEHFIFIRGDFNNIDLGKTFDLVLCISSIEHFGIPGRYSVVALDETADLRAMAKIRTLMNPDAQLILTCPVGVDTLLAPYHRVYGAVRLPQLLDGYMIVAETYYAKFGGKDEYRETTLGTVLEVEPTLLPKHYYALGCFVLEVA